MVRFKSWVTVKPQMVWASRTSMASFSGIPVIDSRSIVRHNGMRTDRPVGGANGGGLVVLNEEGEASRNYHALVPGYRAIDPAQTTPVASDFLATLSAGLYVYRSGNRCVGSSSK